MGFIGRNDEVGVLVCWLVGLVMFVSVSVLLLSDRVVLIVFFLRCGFSCCIWANVVNLGGGLCWLQL